MTTATKEITGAPPLPDVAEELFEAAKQAYGALIGAHVSDDSVQGRARLRLRAVLKDLGFVGNAVYAPRAAEMPGQTEAIQGCVKLVRRMGTTNPTTQEESWTLMNDSFAEARRLAAAMEPTEETPDGKKVPA